MWEKLLNSKHFVVLCASTAVLFLTLSIFIGISAYQSARAQCVTISGLVVGSINTEGARSGGGGTCPTGSSPIQSGINPVTEAIYYVCVTT